MATERTIKELQERVEEAKQGLRSTMSIQELGKEQIRDIVKEVSETQAYISKLFDREDDKLGAGTKALKEELSKLVEEGTDADSARLQEIQKRATAIANIAKESGGEEGEYIGQLADVLSGGAKKAGRIRLGADIGIDDMFGGSLIKTVFGTKITDWMFGDSGGSNRKRQEAEIRLLQRQSELEFETGGGDDEFMLETPSEIAEEKREEKREEKEKVKKQERIVELLEEILVRVGGKTPPGFSTISTNGGGGETISESESFLEDVVVPSLAWGGGMSVGAALVGWVTNFVKTIIPGLTPASKVATVGGGGLEATIAQRLGQTPKTASAGGSLLSKWLLPISAAYEIAMNEIKNLEARNIRETASTTWHVGRYSKQDGSMWDAFTNMEILPSEPDQEDPRGYKRQLDVNEEHIKLRLKEATKIYEEGGWTYPWEVSQDEKANALLEALQGDIYDRQKLVGKMRPQTLEEALQYFAVSNDTYSMFDEYGKRLLESVSFWETKDKKVITSAISMLNMMNPSFKEKDGVSKFFDWSERTSVYTTQPSQLRLRESLDRMGFEREEDPEDWHRTRDNYWQNNFGSKPLPEQYTPIDFGQRLRDDLGIGQEITNPTSIPRIQQLDKNRELNMPGHGSGHYGTFQPQANVNPIGVFQNNENQFRNTIVAGQLLEDQNSIGIGNQARKDIISNANWSLI